MIFFFFFFACFGFKKDLSRPEVIKMALFIFSQVSTFVFYIYVFRSFYIFHIRRIRCPVPTDLDVIPVTCWVPHVHEQP